jgi:hypothetical protein
MLDVVNLLGPYSQHFIFFVNYELSQSARVFVLGKFLQASLMSAIKVFEPTQVNHISSAPLLGRLLALTTNIRIELKNLLGSNSLG